MFTRFLAFAFALATASPLLAQPLPQAHVAETHYLKASNPGFTPRFGYSIALSGDTLVVGAPHEQSGSTGVGGSQAPTIWPGPGAAYVFRQVGGTWAQEAYLKASNTGAGDWFGFSVAIDGDTIVIGAPREASNDVDVGGAGSDNSMSEAGAAYVFSRIGTTWSFDAYLKASNPGKGDWFGRTVAVSGDTIAVGAPLESSQATGVGTLPSNDNAPASGAVYLYGKSPLGWAPKTALKASNSEWWDTFGMSIALSGNDLVVGAPGEDSNATGVGGGQANNLSSGSGAGYTFHRTAGTWTQSAYLKASNTDSFDGFGYAVAIDQDTLVVSADGEDSKATDVNGDQTDNTVGKTGAAYVFHRASGIWAQEAYLKASNTDQANVAMYLIPTFGTSLGISGNRVFVGAPNEANLYPGINPNGSNKSLSFSGAVYGFERQAGIWSPFVYIKASNADAKPYVGEGDQFGSSLAVLDDLLVASSPDEASAASGVDGDKSNEDMLHAGAVYTFDLNASAGFFRYGADPMSSGPDLYSSSPVSAGSSFTFDIRGFYLQGTGMLVIGFAPASVPLLGGTLLVDLSLSIVGPSGFIPVSLNYGLIQFTVPSSSALVGIPLYAQLAMFALEPPNGLVFTPGLELILAP